MILNQSGQFPRRWTSKPTNAIASNLTAREATRRLAGASLAICRECESGVVDDLDTEFLHDYRVSLRRVRSLLKLVKEVYPPHISASIRQQLSEFARRTNRLRDLDVFLLKRNQYVDQVPRDRIDALESMFRDLEAERAEQHQRISEHLQSEGYRAAMGRLQESFEESKWWPVTANSHLPVGILGNRLVPRRYRRISRMITQITFESSDEELHEVRLQAKKFRYLLEFFGPLYDEALIESFTKRLKKMQNMLGTFNDLAVQQDFLRDYIRLKGTSVPDAHDLILGVGSLLGILHHQQKKVRERLNAKIASFADDRTRSLVTEITKQRSRAA
jgi:CHAD domain-containing protein